MDHYVLMLFTHERDGLVLHKLISISFTINFPNSYFLSLNFHWKMNTRFYLFKYVTHCTGPHDLQSLVLSLPCIYFFSPSTSLSIRFILSFMGCLKTTQSSFQSQLIMLFQHQQYILWYDQNFTIMSKYSYPETEKNKTRYKISSHSELWALLHYCPIPLFPTKLLISLKAATDSPFIPWLHLAQSLLIASFERIWKLSHNS